MIWLYVGIVFILFIIYFIAQNTIKGKLVLAYQKKDYETYYKLLDSTIAKISIPAYNLEYMRLNGFIEEGRSEQVDSQLALLFKARKNKEQIENLIQISLQYYVNLQDSSKCHKLLDYMTSCQMDEQILNEATYVVDILVDQKTNHIDELEDKLRTVDEKQKQVYYYLLQVQYEHVNNIAKANEYKRLLNLTQNEKN